VLAAHGAGDGGAQGLALDGLEQVAGGAALECGGQILFVFAHGEHEHFGLWRGFAQAGQRVHTAHAGQVVVEQDQVGLQLLRAALGFAGVGGVAHHLQLWLAREQGHEAAAKEGVVVDHEDADAFRHVL
jgi:hypothetical protein